MPLGEPVQYFPQGLGDVKMLAAVKPGSKIKVTAMA